MADKPNRRKKSAKIPLSLRMNEEIRDKWYQLAEEEHREPPNWLEVVILEKWQEAHPPAEED
jgi:hypothetical protein